MYKSRKTNSKLSRSSLRLWSRSSCAPREAYLKAGGDREQGTGNIREEKRHACKLGDVTPTTLGDCAL